MKATRAYRVLAPAVALAAACSESELRTIYEEPVLYAQPDVLGPTMWTDEYQQRTVPESDILFAIDNSGSMCDEQEELTANFNDFISGFVDTTLDYHIGVVAADLDPGQDGSWGILRNANGVEWIDPNTPDPIGTFNQMASVGCEGSGSCEMGLQASFSALQTQAGPGMPNDGFLRPDALLSVIIVSDEIDHGADWEPFGDGCGGILPSEYIPWWLYSVKGPNAVDMLSWTAIVGDRPGGCDANGNGADEGEGYWDVLDAVDGNFLSVCSDDWGPFLAELGLEAAGLKHSFYLRRIPVESTIVVTVGGSLADPSTYTYSRTRNSITFPLESIPPVLSEIVITYELLEDQGADAPVE